MNQDLLVESCFVAAIQMSWRMANVNLELFSNLFCSELQINVWIKVCNVFVLYLGNSLGFWALKDTRET